MRRCFGPLVTVWLLVLGAYVGMARTAAVQSVPAPASAAPAVRYRAVLDQYCIGCHNQRLKTAGLELDTVDLNQIPAHSEVWEKVVKKLRGGLMPPAGSRRPDQDTYDSFASWIESTLDRAALNDPYAGRTRLHRLNRAEYTNAVRDLLSLTIDGASLLPPDDSSFGFDNIAEVLGVSPALQERYLDAAEKVSALAIGDRNTGANDETFLIRGDVTQTVHLEGLPLGTRGGIRIRKTFPVDGEYLIRAKIFRTNVGGVRGMVWPHDVVFLVDGKEVFTDTVGGLDEVAIHQSGGNATVTADLIDERLQMRVPITAGPHEVVVTFVERNQALAQTMLQPFLAVSDSIDGDGLPKFELVKISGPLTVAGVGDTPSRARVFTCTPTRASDESACAQRILSTLARRAFRRDLGSEDVDLLMRFYGVGRKQGTFDDGIRMGLRFILASPEFAFRAERDPDNAAVGATYRVSDFELASRLSFFLWSSIPDDQLIDLAARRRLSNPATLAQQVTRMLADPKARALTDNFAGQWLYLRNLRTQTPISGIFPNWDDNLRQSMRTETEMLFETVVRQDRPVLDFLTADYTFVNERLARHYGIPNIYGTHFRRVKVTDENRRGLLGHASILTVTSRANRTSPVLRGKWILENILGSPPPQPPPNVPPFPESTPGSKPKTVRETMEQHRQNPTCASCHRMMDPFGFALENFDAIGGYRTHEDGTPIDASVELANTAKVDGVAGLRGLLLRRPETFVQTMTEKMLTYALGRGLDARDMPTVRMIVRDAAGNNFRFSSLVKGIVTSAPFNSRIKEAASGADERLSSAR